LHELSHSITIGENVLDCKNGNWKIASHSDTFYQNFENILRIAEKLEIFILPSKSDKFGLKNIRRLDLIDTDYLPLSNDTIPKYINLS